MSARHDELLRRLKALRARVAEQRAVGDELRAASEHLSEMVADVIERLGKAGIRAEYGGTLGELAPWLNRARRRLN